MGGEFKLDSVVNSDKENRREHGRKLCRRTNTKLTVGGQATCKYRLIVCWDMFGFYVNQKAGNGVHTNHPKGVSADLAFPVRLLPAEEKEFILHCVESSVGAAIPRNYLFLKLGKFLPTASILNMQNEKLLSNDFHKGDPRKLPANDVEGLLNFFKSQDSFVYQVLWDVAIESENIKRQYVKLYFT